MCAWYNKPLFYLRSLHSTVFEQGKFDETYLESHTTIVCTVQGPLCNNTWGLEVHMLKHKEQDSCELTLSLTQFTHAFNLQKNPLIHDDKTGLACGYCQKVFTNNEKCINHGAIHTDKKLHRCNVCQRHFRHSYDLKCHKRAHTNRKMYPCHLCDKRYIYLSTRDKHVLTHSLEPPKLSCDVCKKVLSSRFHLKRHATIHSGEKSYMCKECKKPFREASSLQCHLLIHSGKRPYLCEICGRSFRQSVDLQRHRFRHTGDKPYLCASCGERFTEAWILEKHIQTHNGNDSEL